MRMLSVHVTTEMAGAAALSSRAVASVASSCVGHAGAATDALEAALLAVIAAE